jgi:hypothetical protein
MRQHPLTKVLRTGPDGLGVIPVPNLSALAHTADCTNTSKRFCCHLENINVFSAFLCFPCGTSALSCTAVPTGVKPAAKFFCLTIYCFPLDTSNEKYNCFFMSECQLPPLAQQRSHNSTFPPWMLIDVHVLWGPACPSQKPSNTSLLQMHCIAVSLLNSPNSTVWTPMFVNFSAPHNPISSAALPIRRLDCCSQSTYSRSETCIRLSRWWRTGNNLQVAS